MESINSYFIAEIIAAIAVVVTLIHLAVQIKQTRVQSIKDSMDTITRERGDFIRLLATEKDLSQIIANGLVGRAKLAPKDYFRFTSYLYYLFVQLELGFRKRQRGHIDDDLWEGWDEGVHWWIRCPGVRTWWNDNPAGGYTKGFKTYVNKIIKKVENEPFGIFEKQLDFLEKVGANEEKPIPSKKQKKQ